MSLRENTDDPGTRRRALTQNGQHTAPGDSLDTAPALAIRARPCAAPPLEHGARGRIADGGGPETRLEARPCWSAGGDSGRRAGHRAGSDRGSPNHGSTLLSKRVMAQIRSRARVST